MRLMLIFRANINKYIGLDHQEGDTNAWNAPIVPRDHNLLSRAAAQLLSGRTFIAFVVNLAKRIQTNTARGNAKRALYVLKEKL